MQLIHGDCLEKMKDIPDGSIDMILCDLPYGTTACKWDVVIPFEPLWGQYKRIIKDRGAIALFGSQPFVSLLVSSNLSMYKYDWIWDKKKPAGFQLAKVRPMMKHEHICIFCKGSPIYYPIRTPRTVVKKNSFQSKSESSPLAHHDGAERVYTDFLPKSIIEISNANQRNRFHPTQKPVPLLEYLIKTYTLEGETVLDNTMGSGSTGVACININRDFIGIEKDDKYFEIAKKRIEEHLTTASTGQP
jgi:site-specific DNA-methyltransferase (adenine-specific)